MEHNIKDLGLVAGANLKRLIKNSKYKTQEEFAFEFGTDVRTIGRWVNKGIYDIRILQELSKIFDIDFLAFFSV